MIPYKKSILLITLCFLRICGYASHYSAGYITYRSINDTLYVVEVGVVRDNGGTVTIDTLPITAYLTSSCYPASNFSLPKIIATGNEASPNDNNGGFAINSLYNCGQGLDNSLHLYRDTITIPGTCPDFNFEVAFPCCRHTTLNLSASPNLYLSANLNNTAGPVSLPSPDKDRLISNFCNEAMVTMSLFPEISTSDSIRFFIAQPQEGQIGSPAPISFNAGYSALQPIPTVNGLNISPDMGFLNFQVSPSAAAGNYQFKVGLYTYRYNTNTMQWEQIGGMGVDTYMAIDFACDSIITQGPKLTFENGTTVDTAYCGDSIISLTTNNYINLGSANPTDFRAINVKNITQPIVDVFTADTGTFVQNLRLKFSRDFDDFDTLIIYIKPGNDGNALLNNCGFETAPSYQDTLTLYVKCKSGVGLAENPLENLSVYPNPAYDYLNVSGIKEDEYLKLEIHDINGKLIQKQLLKADEKISIQSLSNGIYFIRIKSSENSRQFKFLKH